MVTPNSIGDTFEGAPMEYPVLNASTGRSLLLKTAGSLDKDDLGYTTPLRMKLQSMWSEDKQGCSFESKL